MKKIFYILITTCALQNLSAICFFRNAGRVYVFVEATGSNAFKDEKGKKYAIRQVMKNGTEYKIETNSSPNLLKLERIYNKIGVLVENQGTSKAVKPLGIAEKAMIGKLISSYKIGGAMQFCWTPDSAIAEARAMLASQPKMTTITINGIQARGFVTIPSTPYMLGELI